MIRPIKAGPADPFIMIITVAKHTNGNAIYLTNPLILFYLS